MMMILRTVSDIRSPFYDDDLTSDAVSDVRTATFTRCDALSGIV